MTDETSSSDDAAQRDGAQRGEEVEKRNPDFITEIRTADGDVSVQKEFPFERDGGVSHITSTPGGKRLQAFVPGDAVELYNEDGVRVEKGEVKLVESDAAVNRLAIDSEHWYEVETDEVEA